MNILVTGCNGQLGRSLQDLQASHPQFNWFNTDVEQLDITKPEKIERYIEGNKIDGIINCAAYTAVDRAEENETMALLLNAEAPAFLARAIEQRNGWFIQISTDYVFDGKKQSPYREDDETQPQSVYGKTKLAGEFNALKFCRQTVIIRTAWLYSVYGANFVKTMLRLGSERDEIGVVDDQHGTPTNAADLASAILEIICQGIKPGIYHYTNEGKTTWCRFAQQIMRYANLPCTVQPLTTDQYPTPAQRPAYSILDKSKIKNEYHIGIPQWQDSLKNTVQQLQTAHEA